MKRDAGGVTAIISILSMQPVSTQGTLTQTRACAYTASGHANADW